MIKAYQSTVECIMRRASKKYRVAAAVAKLEDGTFGEKKALIDPNDMTKIPFKTAVMEGYLTDDEYSLYILFIGVLFLIFVTGQIIFGTSNPKWMGQILWTMTYVVLSTVIPVIKWFNSYEIDR